MTEEELEKYIVRKDDEVTRILFAYEINAEGNMEWHKITKDMASKWKKDLNDVTEQELITQTHLFLRQPGIVKNMRTIIPQEICIIF